MMKWGRVYSQGDLGIKGLLPPMQSAGLGAAVWLFRACYHGGPISHLLQTGSHQSFLPESWPLLEN